LEEAEDVADERDDGVEDVQDDHPVSDVFGEIEAVEQEHLFVVDVVQQIVLEVVASLTRDAICYSYVELGLWKAFGAWRVL